MSKHSRGASRLVQWSADTTWKRLKRDLEMFPDGLKVLELCGGVGTAHVALQELLKDVASFSIVDHFDIDEALEPLLIASGLSSQNMHLGRHEGDILKQSPQDFPLHHLLVAGPPCPPWSSIGCRSSWADARSKPFYKVIDIISYHAQHGALLLFCPGKCRWRIIADKKLQGKADRRHRQSLTECLSWMVDRGT